jgi:probable rRNA maturation factor
MPPVAPATNAPPANGADDAPDADPPIGLDIDVVHEDGDWITVAGADALVRAAAAALAAELAPIRGEVCVALSSDAQVAELNGSYRGKPTPTNVLSFPAVQLLPVDGEPRFLGDIVLALETMRREAAEQKLALEHHMQHLAVHGILHLLGYDHETDDEAQAMESLEVRILARLGIPDPYAAADESIEHS